QRNIRGQQCLPETGDIRSKPFGHQLRTSAGQNIERAARVGRLCKHMSQGFGCAGAVSSFEIESKDDDVFQQGSNGVVAWRLTVDVVPCPLQEAHKSLKRL